MLLQGPTLRSFGAAGEMLTFGAFRGVQAFCTIMGSEMPGMDQGMDGVGFSTSQLAMAHAPVRGATRAHRTALGLNT